MDGAIEHIGECVRLRPAYAMRAHRGLGRILAQAGRPEEAVDEYKKYLRLQPDDARVHNDLGKVLGGLGRLEEAIGHFAEAVRLRPGFEDAQRNLQYARAELYKAGQGK